MWVSGKLPTGHVFFSANVDERNRRKIAIRTRNKVDAERIGEFLDLPVVHTPKGDYKYRVIASRRPLVKLLIVLARGVTYRNYKNTMQSGSKRSSAHHHAWSAFLKMEGAFDPDKDAWKSLDHANRPKFDRGHDSPALTVPFDRRPPRKWVGDKATGRWETAKERDDRVRAENDATASSIATAAGARVWRKDPYTGKSLTMVFSEPGSHTVTVSDRLVGGLEMLVARDQWEHWVITPAPEKEVSDAR